jgi:hypothetical protein
LRGVFGVQLNVWDEGEFVVARGRPAEPVRPPAVVRRGDVAHRCGGLRVLKKSNFFIFERFENNVF